jgi:adenylylsulfate kinase
MNKNIIPHSHVITKKERQSSAGHSSLVVWFTGLSGSGKSTLAGKVEELLFKQGARTYILDGDNVRKGMNNNLGFSPEDRKENIRRIGEMSKLFVDAGIIVLTAFISPYRSDRKIVRQLLHPGEFIEVHVKCPVSVCEERDIKGLYKKARAGEIKDFTGISAPYEDPEKPEITVETNNMTIDKAAEKIYEYIASIIK